MFIFGGDAAPTVVPDRFIYSIEPFSPTGARWTRGEEFSVRLSGHTASNDPTTPTVQARRSEIYDPTADTWTDTGAGWNQVAGPYALHFVVPGAAAPGGGRVLAVGPDPVARYLDIPQTGPPSQGWQTVTNGNSVFRPLTGVMYAPGKVMIAGGAEYNPQTLQWDVVVGTTKTLDATGTSGWQPSSAMLPRYHHNLVLLPSGEVLALGGVTSTSENDLNGVQAPQIWKPSDGTWTDPTYLTADDAIRNYHSAALLLPDGRVLSGGGDQNAMFQETVNIFCPPYLFNGSRPVIDWVTPGNISYGQVFEIGTPTAGTIGSVCLIRAGATTHSFDESQRYVRLDFAASGATTLRAVAPAGGSLAPPGDYLLFILNGSGVPAVAQWVRLGNCPDTPCDADPPPTVADLYADVVGPNEIWLVWPAPGDDYDPALGAYDLRFSTSPITSENAFAAASPMPVAPPDQTPPTPWPSGTQGCAKFNLAPCTSYYFALKTKDGRNNWSAQGTLVTGTPCGGGGGGGFAARWADGEGEGAGAVVSAVSSSGVGDAGAGTSATVSLASTGDAPIAGASGMEAAAGVLVTETRRTPEGAWQVTVRLVTEAEGLEAADAGVIVSQVRNAGGAWKTLGRSQPTPGQSPLGLCALRDQGRVVFPAGYGLDQVVTGLRAGSQDHALSLADHSRLGPLGERFISSGGGVELALGDALTLTYAPSGDPLPGAAGWYLLVRPTGVAGSSPTPVRREPVAAIPTRFALHPNQPNPFRYTTTIAFDLPVASPVTLAVFDLLGRRVTTLAQGEHPAGSHTVEWDLRDASGAPVQPGVYVYRLQAGAFHARRKMSVLP